MARYVDTDDVDALIGTSERLALWDDTAPRDGSSFSTSLFNRAVDMASVLIQASAENAGYSIGSTTTNDMVKIATLVVLIPWAYGRRGKPTPANVLELAKGVPEALRVGALPIPGMDPDASEAIGGSKWVDSTDTTDGRPPVFGDGAMRNNF